MTASFEAAIEPVIDTLCSDCPLRNLCSTVELARLESGMLEGDTVQQELAAIEADAASSIVIAALYKSRNNCDGADIHEVACERGNDKTCPAYSNVVDLINED